MNVAIIVATCGASRWRELAEERALPSAYAQKPYYQAYGVHTEDETVAAARNAAAEIATAEWLCFLDADDQLADLYLRAMEVAVQRHATTVPAPALLAPAVEYVNSYGASLGPPKIPNEGRWPRLNECVIGTLVPRRLFHDVGGFRTDLPSLEDYDLWLRCVRAGARIVHVPDAVYRVWLSPGSRNSDQSPYDEIVAAYPEVFR